MSDEMIIFTDIAGGEIMIFLLAQMGGEDMIKN
jgi:hypothetical protein